MTPARKTPSRGSISGVLLIALGTALAHAVPLVAGPEKPVVSGNQEPDFARDVAPIFQAKCLKCHGDKERKAELDLRTVAALLKGGESGAVVVPKDPDKSLLYEKVL